MSDTYMYQYHLFSALVAFIGLVHYVYVNSKRYKLSHIPTVGYSTPLLTYISAWRYFRDPAYVYETIEEGYRKYPNKLFKVPTLTSWEVIVNSTQAVDEMCKAPVDVVSNILAFSELDYTLGHDVTKYPYHVSVVRGPITRNIAAKFGVVREEVVRGYDDAVEGLRKGTGEVGEWVQVPVYDVTIKLVRKIMARMSVGYPLCENEEFKELCGRAVRTLVKGRALRFFPKFMRPLASRLLINVQKDLRRMAVLIEPEVKQRLEQEAECIASGTEWTEKPAKRRLAVVDGRGEADRALTNALRIIACHPPEEYLYPLREELERVLRAGGDEEAEKGRDGGGLEWTKNAVGRMYLLDSLLREVQRCFDIQPLHVSRKTVQPFVFSDGTLVPPGVTMYANSHAMYRDEARFGRAGNFEGFRYVMDGEGVGDEGVHEKGSLNAGKERDLPTGSFMQPLLAKPALDYHAFGYGKHACPGRFSAVYQLKTMVAHVLMTYDVSMHNPTDKNGSGNHNSKQQGSGNDHRKGYGLENNNDDGADGRVYSVHMRLAGEKVLPDDEDAGQGKKAGMGVATKLWFRKR
ncbi:Cytochrome P450 monooxygenase 71 [Psilocybe cubensis]|uniref:Cytochrome P450 monooxygenase 71 n=1 Tax=Psilocybe cubensis TaxID=181762 RepID=A0ACB8H2S5_PSICU|nr:Cytochrome P450 monooxygenase 71 [Psilocybe cubensis]KAH9482098.1 Cytochrome P450 monooxygenase 71 [Psilocybe cubensis]